MKEKIKNLISLPYFKALLLSITSVISWALFILFFVLFKSSIDYNGYYEALKTNKDILITSFYNGSSLIFQFLGFLFLVVGMALTIWMIIEWLKLYIRKHHQQSIGEN